MARPTTPKRVCKDCGKVVEARMIQSAIVDAGDFSTVVFHHTLPVFICRTCDTAPQRRRDTVHGPA